MQITITIDGKPVTFAKNGATMLLYKRLFGREYFADLGKIIKAKRIADKVQKPAKAKKKKTEDEQLEELAEQLEHLDVEVYYNILYVMAKAADPSIPDQVEWFGGFENFDVIPVFNQISPMLARELAVDPKNASPEGAAAETAG